VATAFSLASFLGPDDPWPTIASLGYEDHDSRGFGLGLHAWLSTSAALRSLTARPRAI